MESGSNRTVGAVETAFAVVRELEARGPCGVTALADAMDLPKSTVHKHLATLVDEGYVRRRDGRYRVGFKFLQHGGVVRDRCRLYTFGRPKVESLVDDVSEMVILSIREGDRGVFLFRSNDRYNLKESLPMGARFNLHSNGAGKAMLAASSDAFVRDLADAGLPAETPETITDPDVLFAEVERVREAGYALNHGERDSGVQAVSAPIRDAATGDVGAISISVPSGSPAVDHLDGEYAEAVQRAASELTLQLEHS
ncbi:IclR family transcriptional regulator [Halocalculus aciditolerans]|uniref:IclR family transcriptional regulator n=1 Tax=Halocalculus aciditolerans TaxID=1383812 RepID=A0A830FDG4_9EURY|nr:IclR family transcriptional regulator [Halocalculus aciditolerans]GGL64030.1 IclR family transcriptional regulator [Halocalculus aciditolerans]